MRRRLTLIAAVAAALAGPAAGIVHADGDDDDRSPPDPKNRLEAWAPENPGTVKTIKLQYGPYVVQPGSDLSRIDAEVVPADGFVIAAKPSARFQDGSEPSHQELHIHHAHWVKVNPEKEEYASWFFGTGEEETEGGGDDYMKADPRYDSEGLRYGIPLYKGDKLAFVSMLHNKTSQPMTVWLEGEMTLVTGSREEIKNAPEDPSTPYAGTDVHPLKPVLHGRSFNVPRTGGEYVWPRDAAEGDEVVNGRNVKRGVGDIWTAPFDGTIVIGAGHLHPGGRQVVVSNLGSESQPCTDEGDGYAGKTILRVDAYYRDGVFPSEDFQMGITQKGWRAKIKKGDRIAINGIYDAADYAYPDAMSFFGFYADLEDPPAEDEHCQVELLDQPGAPQAQVIGSMPNREWPEEPDPTCEPGTCDSERPEPEPGPRTNVVHIAAFSYAPGNLGTSGQPFGPPVVERGEKLRFVNEDWALGGIRHTATTCKAPCNGPYVSNYPFHDGSFDTGVLGATPLDTYITVRTEPTAEIDTSDLEPGRYTYFCRLHPSMRGSVIVD